MHGEAADEQPLHGGIGADKGGHSQAAHLTKHEPSHEAGDGLSGAAYGVKQEDAGGGGNG